MKKLLFTAIFVLVLTTVHAQTELTFKPFKFDISAGYLRPTKTDIDDANGGFLISLEPKYAVSDYITLGVKAETALSVNRSEEIKGTGSYLATCDYYFNTNIVRPFIGAGIGVYIHASDDLGSGADIKGYTQLGGAPRIGIEIAHFRAAMEYNLAGKVAGFSKNYLGIKMGVLIGGGRIN